MKMKQYEFDGSWKLMVEDRFGTDIICENDAGVNSALNLTGCSTV
jgi:ribonucleotide monophosphatase NagD (HAD superfamily)